MYQHKRLSHTALHLLTRMFSQQVTLQQHVIEVLIIVDDKQARVLRQIETQLQQIGAVQLRDGNLTIGFEPEEGNEAVAGGLAILIDPAAPAGVLNEARSSLSAALSAADRAPAAADVACSSRAQALRDV